MHPKKQHRAPISAKSQRTAPPRKPSNLSQRTREYLTDSEVEDLRKAASQTGRYPLRDATLILLMFRHALRVSEAISLRWEQIDFGKGLMHVTRAKNGTPATHYLEGMELRVLRQLRRQTLENPYVFVSERRSPLTSRTIHHIIARAGIRANLSFTVHPHMLRHSTGFHLASRGKDTRSIQGYMGHANIKNTIIYTELSPSRFKNFWK